MEFVFPWRAASLVCGLASVLCAQPPKAKLTPVPFVGCKSDGQTGPKEAPKGNSVVVSTGREAAEQLAYYKSAQGIGVLAPRGWHCFGVYGSGGDTLYVTSNSAGLADFFLSAKPAFTGPVIQLSRTYGDGSGRNIVAEVIARVFPIRRAFVTRVMEIFEMPANSFPDGPHPTDKLTYRSQNVVEFETPAHQEGLGTMAWIAKNDSPIQGVAILFGSAPNLLHARIRLPASMRELAPAIVSQVETDAVRPGK